MAYRNKANAAFIVAIILCAGLQYVGVHFDIMTNRKQASALIEKQKELENKIGLIQNTIDVKSKERGEQIAALQETIDDKTADRFTGQAAAQLQNRVAKIEEKVGIEPEAK